MQLRQRRGRQPRRHRYPQSRGRLSDSLQVRTLGRGRRSRVRCPLGDRVEEQRRIEHRARQHAVDDKPVPGVDVRRERHTCALGLQPEQPAARGREADRSARRRLRARRRRGRPSTAAALPPLEPPVERCEFPRVARHPAGRRLGQREHAELGHVRLADDHRACRTHATDHLRVRRRGVAIGVRADRRDLAGHVESRP